MANVIIIAILCVIFVFAILEAVKHFQGKGSCCGGGDSTILIKPEPLKNVAATKQITVEGMKCKNCSARVQNALNEMGNVNATVNLKKKTAIVKTGEGVTDEQLKAAIEEKGYKVTDIKNI